jgi:hypothetical protein
MYYTLIDNLRLPSEFASSANGAVTFSGAYPIPANHGRAYSRRPRAALLPNRRALFQRRSTRRRRHEAAAKTPTVNEWNLTIEQQLFQHGFARWVCRIVRVSRILSIDPNTIPAQICSSASCATGGTGAARGTVAQGEKYIPVLPAPVAPASSVRPNPYLGAGFFWLTGGNSSYNALQLELNRRLAHGLQFRTNYTWAKNLDMNSALTIAQAQNQPQMVLDRNDVRRDWAHLR